MFDKKKIAFYAYLTSGHITVCVAVAKSILRQYEDKVDIYFIVDQIWKEKISKLDSRFKFAQIDYDKKESENRMLEMVDKFKPFLTMDQVERTIKLWPVLIEDKTAIEIDKLTEIKLNEIKPDFVICDQIIHLPSVQSYPYGFITSTNPLAFRLNGFPNMGIDTPINDKKQIKEIAAKISEVEAKCIKTVESYFIERNIKIPDVPLGLMRPLSEHFSIYSYPAELDYYSEEIKEKYKLLQIDGPLFPEAIPLPFELPEDFKSLSGKIIYFSLGSLFSAYVDHLQKMINILDKVSNAKFIISKGPRGDQILLPSKKFIGANYVDQLAILQIADLFISHGGNNSFGESFYFGVKQIIAAVLGDQLNNSQRINETGYGYTINLMDYTEEELLSTIEKALNDTELEIKLKKASERIQNEKRIHQIGNKIFNYVNNL